MSFQDWNEIKWDKRGENNKTDKDYMNKQMRNGNIIQKLKSNSDNKNKINVVTNIKKIENEEDTFKHRIVGSEVGKRIAQTRCEKKITQKELANAIFLPESIIKEFETGKAIYNAVVLNKIEKYLGKKLRN